MGTQKIEIYLSLSCAVVKNARQTTSLRCAVVQSTRQRMRAPFVFYAFEFGLCFLRAAENSKLEFGLYCGSRFKTHDNEF
jgi:hypothetical protein